MKVEERSLALAAASRAGPGVRAGEAFTPSKKCSDLRFPIASVHRSDLIHPYAVITAFPVFPFILTITSYPLLPIRFMGGRYKHHYLPPKEKREEIPWHEEWRIKQRESPMPFESSVTEGIPPRKHRAEFPRFLFSPDTV